MRLEVVILDSRAVSFIEESFLKPLLEIEGVTDISFNGKAIFYLHNELGRLKSDILVSNEDVKAFLRHLANLCEQQFSYMNPFLDISIGKYRLNAVFHTVGRNENNKVYTFSLRIASSELKIYEGCDFLDENLNVLFKTLLNNNVSIVIGGITGSGKTEFQKYLIHSLKENTRLIVIDNILELDGIKEFDHLDLTIWQSDEKLHSTSIQNLVKNALRNNPDFIVVAESRGAEMIEVLNSSMTGHPIITTIHSYDAESLPNRMSRMVMMNDKKMDYKDVYYDVCHHFPIAIYLERDMKDGKVHRYIKKVLEISNDGNHNTLYEKINNQPIYGKFKYDLTNRLINVDPLFKAVFLDRG